MGPLHDSDSIAVMINRIVVLSTLLLAFALSINFVLDEAEVPEEKTPRNEPDLYMLNATIEQFDEDGLLQHRIDADRFTHFPLTDLTTMKSPAMALAHSDNSAPWDITAAEGRILPGTNYREEVVELWNNVLAARNGRQGRFVNIQTESLTIYPEQDYLETDAKVFIDNETGRTTAAGMQAFLDEGRFMFYSTDEDRVTTIFLPN